MFVAGGAPIHAAVALLKVNDIDRASCMSHGLDSIAETIEQDLDPWCRLTQPAVIFDWDGAHHTCEVSLRRSSFFVCFGQWVCLNLFRRQIHSRAAMLARQRLSYRLRVVAVTVDVLFAWA